MPNTEKLQATVTHYQEIVDRLKTEKTAVQEKISAVAEVTPGDTTARVKRSQEIVSLERALSEIKSNLGNATVDLNAAEAELALHQGDTRIQELSERQDQLEEEGYKAAEAVITAFTEAAGALAHINDQYAAAGQERGRLQAANTKYRGRHVATRLVSQGWLHGRGHSELGKAIIDLLTHAIDTTAQDKNIVAAKQKLAQEAKQ